MNSHFKIFLAVLIIFLISLIGLFLVGLVPEEIKGARDSLFKISEANPRELFSAPQITLETDEPDAPSVADALNFPTRVIIEKIGVNAPVSNPESRDIAVLDNALLSGAVRYPTSGLPGGNSPLFLFGHSTTFSTVRNHAYKTFNRLENLNIGDAIKVEAGGLAYQYLVTSVALVDQDAELIEFADGDNGIVLSTCNTFGQKSERIVVKGRLVESRPIN